jgi:peptidoglycan/xylan/chitin deacetylase (PgdA/CDA1 family)
MAHTLYRRVRLIPLRVEGNPDSRRFTREAGRCLSIAVLTAAILGGCATKPAIVPLPHTEATLGAPLPYEPPPSGLQTAPPLAPVEPRVVAHGPRKRKWIALTFDACATFGPSRVDQRVIDTLIANDVPATLFLGGKWMVEHPDTTRMLASHPQFELANHTYLHPHLTRETDERVREELSRTQDVLFTLTGRRATLLRPPYGEVNTHVARLAAEAGLTVVQFDLASGDPDPHISTKRLIEYVTDMSKRGSIVVMHMNGRGWHTADALPRIILRLRKKGYRFVTVSTLLRLPPAPAVTTWSGSSP